ncbi:hypothetical protein RP300_01925 [Oligella urethralis]|nr:MULTISPECIES: DUF6162 family protein [Oligella]OFV46439.1 hypothetical protein HMPREF3179_09990 [Oligella sp. HMSC09E12]PMC17342.1 hypothetical protein CJ230_06225 [Oligella urethralis]WOS38356.1 hypothetical protein RP300_01925 [Oligella urethralis]
MGGYCQTVHPDKATKETLYVILVAIVIVIGSGVFIFFHQRDEGRRHTLAPYEVSARYDLKATEQGLVTDLLLVYEEWLDSPSTEAPSVQSLIDDNFPPFTDVQENKQRGDHQWHKLSAEGRTYYLGLSQRPEIAGHLLWILPRDKSVTEGFELWIYSKAVEPPALRHLEADRLAAAGWQRVNLNNEIKR